MQLYDVMGQQGMDPSLMDLMRQRRTPTNRGVGQYRRPVSSAGGFGQGSSIFDLLNQQRQRRLRGKVPGAGGASTPFTGQPDLSAGLRGELMRQSAAERAGGIAGHSGVVRPWSGFAPTYGGIKNISGGRDVRYNK